MNQSIRLIDYNLTSPKPGADQAIKQFVKNNTKLIEVNSIDNNNYHSALTTNENQPEVKHKLDSFEQKQELDDCLDIVSRRSLEGAFKELQTKIELINKFRQKFTVKELEDILQDNKQFYIVVGEFRRHKKNKLKELKDHKGTVFELKTMGNKNSSKAMFIIKHASDRDPDWVYIIYCTTQDEYSKDQQFQKDLIQKRNKGSNLSNSSSQFKQAKNSSQSSKVVNSRHKETQSRYSQTRPQNQYRNSSQSNQFRGSNTSNRSKNSRQSNQKISISSGRDSRERQAGNFERNQQQELEYSPRASQKSDEEKGSIDMRDENPSLNFCDQCEDFRVIDDKNRLCWQCFRKHGKQDYINILWYVIFFASVVFLLLLNYHHARENSTISNEQSYKFIDTASSHSYSSIFERHEEVAYSNSYTRLL